MKTAAVLILLAMTGCTTASRQAGNLTVNITDSKKVRIVLKGNDATQDAAKKYDDVFNGNEPAVKVGP